jgi:hypothetical protein
MSNVGDTLGDLVADHSKTVSQVSVKAVGSQLVLMTIISVSFPTFFEVRPCTDDCRWAHFWLSRSSVLERRKSMPLK